MAEPIDYLKTYLNMNPEDYSRMQAQIGGETLPDREIFTMPARAMPMPMPMPTTRQAMEPMPMPAPQNTEVQALMDEIASLKAQIQAMQDTPEPMPAVDEAPVMPSAPSISDLQNRMAVEPMPLPRTTVPQAPVGITNRMIGEPQRLPTRDETVSSLPMEQIQKSLDMLSKLPKTNIPIIPDMDEIRRKIADANINIPTPVNFQDQLEAIKDIPTMQPVNQISPTMPANPVFPTTPFPPRRTGARNFLETQNRFAPMRFAGGGLSKALSELKTRIS